MENCSIYKQPVNENAKKTLLRPDMRQDFKI